MARSDGESHPSFLELDRWSLGAAPGDVGEHVRACAICSAHLERLGVPAGARAEVPPWARSLGPRRPIQLIRSRPSWFRSLSFGVAAFACLALVWIEARRPSRQPAERKAADAYVGAKGAPGLWLYVNRGQSVRLWNGSDPVMPGDVLRLKIQGSGYHHVNVFAPAPSPPGYQRLYEGLLGDGPVALPVAWEVDARPGDETLVVVLGPTAVPPGDVARLLSRSDGGGVWLRRLVLNKPGAGGGR